MLYQFGEGFPMENNLLTLQKSTIRYIFKLSNKAFCREIFEEHNLSLYQAYICNSFIFAKENPNIF